MAHSNQKAREFLAEKLEIKIPIVDERLVIDEFTFNQIATIMDIYKLDGILEHLKKQT